MGQELSPFFNSWVITPTEDTETQGCRPQRTRDFCVNTAREGARVGVRESTQGPSWPQALWFPAEDNSLRFPAPSSSFLGPPTQLVLTLEQAQRHSHVFGTRGTAPVLLPGLCACPQGPARPTQPGTHSVQTQEGPGLTLWA